MVAYDSIAYGSLLRIVAYENLLFHVPNIIAEQVIWNMSILPSHGVQVIEFIKNWKTKRKHLKPNSTFSCPWNINAKWKMRRTVEFGHMKKWNATRQIGGKLGSSDKPSP